jgi:ferric-dicitrate binding protein FerR (iron transport regulator)
VDYKNQIPQENDKFLYNEEFIKWQLFRTNASEKQWNDFIANNPQYQKEIEEAIRQFHSLKINKKQLAEQEKTAIYHNIVQKITKHKRRKVLKVISYAAAVLLIFVISGLFMLNKMNRGPFIPQKSNLIVGRTLPEEEIYLISGENITPIDQKLHIGITSDNKAFITDSSSREEEILLPPEEMNKLVVPYGKRTSITLSDGTKVWLNSGTQLDFPGTFEGENREIYVTGEIFIDVAENAKQPFIVHTAEMDIQVYGTSFNVSAYDDDATKTVVLVKGKIQIITQEKQVIDLSPNEKVEKQGGQLSKEEVDVSGYISWTKGIMKFNETTMSDILKKVGRYYNVQFENNSGTALNEKSCSGKLFLSNNLDSVMTSISVLSSTTYKRENNIIHISKK